MASGGETLYLTYQGRVYDVAKFAEKHPGGAEVLRQVEGRDIEKYLDGSDGIDGDKHKHSQNAQRILEKYSLEPKTQTKAETVDLDSAVVCQVWRLGPQYWSWIHQPVDKELRMFESDFLEYFSRTKWFIIPIVWLPLVLLLYVCGLSNFTHTQSFPVALVTSLFCFGVGVLAWTLIEYALHRFAFHWHPDPNSPAMITLHFVLHGLHHKTPMDKGRLVFPPVLAAVCVLLFYLFYRWLLPWPVCLTFAAGNLLGYVIYDVCHYYLHHGTPKPPSMAHHRKTYHHAHHFKNPDLGYGISTELWDVVFGTLGSSS